MRNLHAAIFCSLDDRRIAWNGVEPCIHYEETRHKGDAFRERGQEGFFDPAIRLFLFLYHIRRRI